MIVVDSSGWIEFFTDGALADEYSKRLRQPQSVVTPTIVIYEVYKQTKRLLSEQEAVDCVAAMKKTQVVALSEEIALSAADLSLAHKLPMADAIILATAQAYDAEVVTSDADFDGIPGVVHIPKRA